jgi:hypothetical protein
MKSSKVILLSVILITLAVGQMRGQEIVVKPATVVSI